MRAPRQLALQEAGHELLEQVRQLARVKHMALATVPAGLFNCPVTSTVIEVPGTYLPAGADAFLKAVAPFRDGPVVGVECLFCWYWLAVLCAAEKIAFVLGHALYMKAIHGGKAKNDQIDAGKIARLECLLSQETWALDPVNVFGAAACGHRRLKLCRRRTARKRQ